VGLTSTNDAASESSSVQRLVGCIPSAVPWKPQFGTKLFLGPLPSFGQPSHVVVQFVPVLLLSSSGKMFGYVAAYPGVLANHLVTVSFQTYCSLLSACRLNFSSLPTNLTAECSSSEDFNSMSNITHHCLLVSH
jgi:hypothetical protein